MPGMMMNTPRLISSILQYAAAYHGNTEIASRTVEGRMHRYTFADLSKRSKQLSILVAKCE